MLFRRQLALGVSFVLFGFVAYHVHHLSRNLPAPDLGETYWGSRGVRGDEQDVSVRPFEIRVSDVVLEDLRQRLEHHRPLTPPLEDSAQNYGMNTKLLAEIVDMWKNKYDWRAREKILNRYPQYKTRIQGLDIHFIHIKANVEKGKNVVPLLILHGWPGSVREFFSLIPLLLEAKNLNLELVIPTLPGFGFSEATVRPGLGSAQMAVVFKNLMLRLGFDQFYAHGGDFGGHIISNMGSLFDANLLGIHLNFCTVNTPLSMVKWFVGSLWPTYFVEEGHADKMYPISTILKEWALNGGYFHMQTTKPDTLGVGLDDSPVGLASYMLEKFSWLTHPDFINRNDAGLKLKFDYEDLLDNVMIFWINKCMTTATRIYAETFNIAHEGLQLDRVPIYALSACARFPNEIVYQSDWILKDRFVNMIQSTNMPRGGHFAALEEPQLLAADIISALEKMERLRH